MATKKKKAASAKSQPHKRRRRANQDTPRREVVRRPALDVLRDVLDTRFRARDDDESTPSVVFIMGAGASLEAGFPTWADRSLRERLYAAVIGTGGMYESAFITQAFMELDSLRIALGKGMPRTRDTLLECARTDELCAVAYEREEWKKVVIEFLENQYRPPLEDTRPQLAYELTAHLMKHRFVDHVITLNFDEVLDAALNDELGRNGYQLILPGRLMAKRGRELPHLVKLHGTISDSDSLRFSRERTGALDRGVKKVLTDLLFAEEDMREVWIVSLGYSWADPDLCELIGENKSRLAGVIAVTKDETSADRIKRALDLDQRLSIACTQKITEKRPEDEQLLPATIDEVLWAVWRRIMRDSKEKAERVPSAARHLLVSHLFPSSADSPRRWPSVYNKYSHAARFEAEVLLAAGKSKEIVTLSALARDDRISRHWPAQRNKEKLAVAELEFMEPSGGIPDVTDIFCLKLDPQQYKAFYKDNKGIKLSVSGQYIENCSGVSIDRPYLMSSGNIRRETMKYYNFVAYYLGKVFDGPAVEIDPGPDLRASFLFRHPKQLPTYKAVSDETDGLLRNPQWRSLLLITEAGNWLERFEKSFDAVSGRTVFVIEAAAVGLGLDKRTPLRFRNTNVLTIGIPWYAHNRHVTLSLDDFGGPSAGIYFRRRERTPRISPIALKQDRRDQEELMRIIYSYLSRYYESYAGSGPEYENYDTEEFYLAFKKIPIFQPFIADPRWVQRLDAAWDTYLQRKERTSSS